MTKLFVAFTLVLLPSILGTGHTFLANKDDQDSYSSGILIPGGSFTGVDGVTVDASLVEGDFELEVFVERLTEDELGVAPPHFGTPATAFYRIGAVPEHFTGNRTPFLIRIPLPEDINVEGMDATVLAPPRELTDIHLPEGHPGIWLPVPVEYLSETNEAQLNLSSILSEGLIIGIAEGVY